MSLDRTSLRIADRKLVLILNHKAGKRQGDAVLRMLQSRLSRAAGGFELIRVSRGAEIVPAARRALRQGADIVAVLGGDGTQSAVAGVLAGTPAIMGVLPGGTFNYFARGLGVGDTVEQALETLLTGQPRRVAVGEVNGRVFLNNVSFGVYPRILKRRESLYARWGRSRIVAYWSLLSALWDLRRPLRIRLQADERQQLHDTALAFVGMNAFQLDSLNLDGAEQVRQGHFAIFVARARKRSELIGPVLRLASGTGLRESDFELITADSVRIETHPNRRLVAFDGEKARMSGPFHLRVRPEALTVIAPAGPDPG
ncbi:diacylglycerol kinase family protein [uncultured Paracoccus sp.]|uniref:diacylglycerol/lipid kinase family protein n=1 Tax=uncultured Paracoccus sp. TaxID=189685 RepID=UPI0025D4AC6F|nr:diacylglycerol kinase family protein [uncultured Paracoccus sp.]